MAEVDKVDKALQVMKGLQEMDKGMLQSKKFVGFMTIQICGTALMFYGIYSGQSDAVLMMIQGSLGAAQTAFLGAQAWHDKHTKTAKMAALNGGVTASLETAAEGE
jgi:hypothetical protein